MSVRLLFAFAVASAVGFALSSILASQSPAAQARAGWSFACSWRWHLEAGLRPGYVIAANSVNCGRRQGSLTLSVRLQIWDAKTKQWRANKAQSTTWTDPRGTRRVEIARRCSKFTARAVFGWILRDTRETLIRTHSLTTASLHVLAATCQVTFGGAGATSER